MEQPPIRVCFLIDSLCADAGTEKLVANVAGSLDPRRIAVHVCCFESSKRMSGLAGACATATFPLTRLYSLNGIRQLCRFRRYLAAHRIDIIHAFMTKSAIFGVLAALPSGSPKVITSRLSTGYWYTPFMIRLFRILNRYTARILTNSHAARDLTVVVEHVAAEKVDVIYNGVDLVEFSRETGEPGFLESLGVPHGAPVVGIVANFRAVKDIGLFLRACTIVSREFPAARFVIVGQGPLREQLGALAATLGIGSKVVFSDGRGSVPDYLCRMSVACLSSQSEGLPNAILEYMAAGLPVVATDVGGIREVVEDGASGFLVRVRTPEAFAEPVLRLLRNDELRLAMSQRSLQRCRTTFDIRTSVQALEHYYQALLPREETFQ
jgi:L-malate glycosyltransferase